MTRRHIWFAILLAGLLAAFVWLAARHPVWMQAQGQEDDAPQLYQGVLLDAALLRLDKRALEEAYHAQLLKLFSVWMASGAPSDAAALQNGLRIARRAYGQAAQQISRREQQLLEEQK